MDEVRQHWQCAWHPKACCLLGSSEIINLECRLYRGGKLLCMPQGGRGISAYCISKGVWGLIGIGVSSYEMTGSGNS